MALHSRCSQVGQPLRALKAAQVELLGEGPSLVVPLLEEEAVAGRPGPVVGALAHTPRQRAESSEVA